MILGRDLITTLGMDLTFSYNIMIGGDGQFEGFSAPMVDVIRYDFTYLTDKIVKPKESFINSYVYECLKSNREISSTQQMNRIKYYKCEKLDINKVMTEKCQHVFTRYHEILLQ